MSFWKTATDEQKIEQIKGGIEVGMNSRQVAMNLGATYTNITSAQVTNFWKRQGFKFPHNKIESTHSMREIARATSGRKAGVPEVEKKFSFKIFDHDDTKPDPFEGLGSY